MPNKLSTPEVTPWGNKTQVAAAPARTFGCVAPAHDVELPDKELFFSHVHSRQCAGSSLTFLELTWERTIDPARVFDLELASDRHPH